MKIETICLHEGYETDQTTKSCAVPIYQTVAYEFDSAQSCRLQDAASGVSPRHADAVSAASCSTLVDSWTYRWVTVGSESPKV